MIRRNRREAHSFITAVDQHTRLSEIGGQIMDVRIVNPQQDRCLRICFIHPREKERGIAVKLLQRAVTQPHFMRR
ncbi:Uncharacterised protein [Shigella sonnei]|nr:Uncharacterised protein [Shigella sonnei]CSF94359.1 Uncharacterised protein [Shigella sonnei]CSG36654.1 Uncharacterised protein [Shigella sonnei]CSH57712.1 Uncharacterised protein [Shigella sonnei]CSS07221.1 Uncharacterised protein [Shigella sonnei]